MALALRELGRLFSCTTHNSRAAPFFGRRLLCAGALEQAKEDEDCHEGGGVLSKTALMQEEGFTEPQIKTVLDLHPRSDKLALLLTILKDRGITGPTAGAFVSSHRNLLHGNLNQFYLRLQVLEDAGISSTLLKEVILQRLGRLSSLGSSETFRKHHSFLKDVVGLSSQESFVVILRCTAMFKLCIEKRLKPRWELLYKKGCSKDGLCKLARNHPSVFTASEAYIQQNLQLIEDFGLDLKTRNGMRALGYWCQYSKKTLNAKFDSLKTLGLSHEEAILLVHRMPAVLCIEEKSLKQKFEFFRDTVKLSVENMLRSSTLFTCSLEKRVIPRWAIVQDLKVKGLLKKPVSMISVCAVSNKAFAKRYNVDPQLLL